MNLKIKQKVYYETKVWLAVFFTLMKWLLSPPCLLLNALFTCPHRRGRTPPALIPPSCLAAPAEYPASK